MLMQFPVISVTLRRTWPGAVWSGFTKDPATQQRGVLGLLLSRYDAGESLTILFLKQTIGAEVELEPNGFGRLDMCQLFQGKCENVKNK